uniref:Uncharacterized protein n=1 Tax=viral metagenome TaxID=1070528 RepID=A0A6C0DCE4_9ZZZZ
MPFISKNQNQLKKDSSTKECFILEEFKMKTKRIVPKNPMKNSVISTIKFLSLKSINW